MDASQCNPLEGLHWRVHCQGGLLRLFLLSPFAAYRIAGLATSYTLNFTHEYPRRQKHRYTRFRHRAG